MKNLIIIGGPTAVGKTDLAIWLAKKLKTQIVSADSRQIYKEMNIGVARPSPEELAQVKHYFIATKSVTEYYNASMYENEALEVINKLFETHDNVIVAGGSGLYIDAIIRGIDDIPTVLPGVRHNLAQLYKDQGIEKLRDLLSRLDPDYYGRADLNNPMRLLKALEVTIQANRPYSSFLQGQAKKRPFNIIIIGLDRPREDLYDRINKRVLKMIDLGLVEEVRSLQPYRHHTALKTVGYNEIFQYLDGKISLDEAIDLIQRNTRKYARKQLSWFRRYKDIVWFNPQEKDEIWDFLTKKIAKFE